MAGQVLYLSRLGPGSAGRLHGDNGASDKLPMPLRLAIIACLAVASWMPIVLLLA